MMKKVLTVSFIFLFVLPLFSLKIPDKPYNYINDYAGILKPGEENYLNAELKKIEDLTSIQIVAAVFKSLEGENLEDYSIRLAEKWKIGKKGKDNGVLLTFFMKERKIRLEVGYGLESKLTDAYSKKIITNNIAPFFKEKRYFDGINSGINNILNIVNGKPVTLNKTSAYQKIGHKKKSLFGIIVNIIISLFVIFMVIRHPWLIFLFLSRGFSSGGSYRSGGFGGFSGGGGGSFGGGGASGGW